MKLPDSQRLISCEGMRCSGKGKGDTPHLAPVLPRYLWHRITMLCIVLWCVMEVCRQQRRENINKYMCECERVSRHRKCRPEQLNAEPELEFQFVNRVTAPSSQSSLVSCLHSPHSGSSWAIKMKVGSVLTLHIVNMHIYRCIYAYINDTPSLRKVGTQMQLSIFFLFGNGNME